MSDHDPTTVGALVKKLREMTGHLVRRDRETVTAAVDAILELSARLNGIDLSDEVCEYCKARLPKSREHVHQCVDGGKAMRRTMRDRHREVRGLHVHSLTSEDPETGMIVTEAFPPPREQDTTLPARVDAVLKGECGKRCQVHDECELACVLAPRHELPCRCAMAVDARMTRLDA